MPESAAVDLNELAERLAAVEGERDEYKRQYVLMLEAYRKLEAGLTRHQRERFEGGGEQTTLSLLSMLTGESEPVAPAAASTTKVEAYTRVRPTGRKPLPDALPRINIEVLPLEVQKAGLDAFDRIGEDVSETVERRPASFVVVRTVRGKYIEKEKVDALAIGESTQVLQGAPLELPIPRGLAGPGLLADTIVRRWQDHLPLHRLERIYGREGFPLARSTVCSWHQAVAALTAPLVKAMLEDALSNSPYLCVDATGVLVQDVEKCRRGHFFVMVAPSRHVLFQYSATHDGKAVRLFVDGKNVKEQAVAYRPEAKPIPGPLLIGGAYVGDQHIGCDGLIDDVRLSSMARRITGVPAGPLPADARTVGLWRLDGASNGRLEDASGKKNHGRLRAR